MSEDHRGILNRHWHMLIKYINTTDALIENLVSEKVLPTSMADDIRLGDSAHVRNERLLKSLKIVGTAAFRKFRQIILEHGHACIAELLWDEEHSSFIEECDFSNYPAFKNSLNPMERKQLLWLLDSKVKTRLLQSEWRNNSEERLKKINNKTQQDSIDTDELKRTITRMNSDLSAKNETLKTMVRDYNLMNDDVVHFEKRHQLNRPRNLTVNTKATTMSTMRTTIDNSNNSDCDDGNNALEILDTSAIQESRFKEMDNCICEMDQQLSTLLGEGEAKPFASVRDLSNKTKRLRMLVRELEATVDRHSCEQKQVQELICLDDPQDGNSVTLLQYVHKFVDQEQNKRVALLGDVDNLSKKLRGITDEDSNSALKGLRQSAVTGSPAPEIVDFRFLRNHIALLMADADHMAKKISWKEEELNTLKAELNGSQYRMSKVSSDTTSSGSFPIQKNLENTSEGIIMAIKNEVQGDLQICLPE